MDLWLTGWPWGLLALVAVTAAVTDCWRGMIYNWLTYSAAVLAVIGHALTGGWGGSEHYMGVTSALIGLVWALPFVAAWLAGGVGGGDAKLLMAIGLIMGSPFVISVMLYGLVIAALMAIVLIILKRRLRRTLGRVGRFLWLFLARGTPADPAEEGSPMVPLGLALALGSVAATAEWIARGIFPHL
jgi:prepilin peptidase CpaA